MGSSKDLFLVFGAHVATSWADWVSYVGALVLLHAMAPRHSFATAGFMVARLLPPLLLAPLAHVVAAAFEKRRVLAACNVAGAAVVLGFLGIQRPPQLPSFYVVATLQQTLFAVYDPTRRALVPEVCRGNDWALTVATAADAFARSLVMCVGAVSGGALATSAAGLPATFACAAAALTVAAAATLLAARQTVGASRLNLRSGEDEDGGYGALASTGAAYLLGPGQRRTLRLLCVKASAAVAWGVADVLEVALASQPAAHRWGGFAAPEKIQQAKDLISPKP